MRLALQLVEARTRAAGKFSRADRMWLDRLGCEQSTSEPVARHKARRFSGEVDDLCCGIGGDSIALAECCTRVSAVDHRASACLMTAWNADVYEVGERVVTRTEDVSQFSSSSRLVHIDPDRRAGRSDRSRRIEDYVPGLEFLHSLMESRPGGAIKVGPASNFGGKFPGCEVELVSWKGECKEATVWFGELAGAAPSRATLLPSGETIVGDPLEAEASQRPPAQYVYDPDPAVVRSGLLDAAALRLNLSRLDMADEYLTGSELVTSPFVQAFECIAELPNNDRENSPVPAGRPCRAGRHQVSARPHQRQRLATSASSDGR